MGQGRWDTCCWMTCHLPSTPACNLTCSLPCPLFPGHCLLGCPISNPTCVPTPSPRTAAWLGPHAPPPTWPRKATCLWDPNACPCLLTPCPTLPHLTPPQVSRGSSHPHPLPRLPTPHPTPGTPHPFWDIPQAAWAALPQLPLPSHALGSLPHPIGPHPVSCLPVCQASQTPLPQGQGQDTCRVATHPTPPHLDLIDCRTCRLPILLPATLWDRPYPGCAAPPHTCLPLPLGWTFLPLPASPPWDGTGEHSVPNTPLHIVITCLPPRGPRDGRTHPTCLPQTLQPHPSLGDLVLFWTGHPACVPRPQYCHQRTHPLPHPTQTLLQTFTQLPHPMPHPLAVYLQPPSFCPMPLWTTCAVRPHCYPPWTCPCPCCPLPSLPGTTPCATCHFPLTQPKLPHPTPPAHACQTVPAGTRTPTPYPALPHPAPFPHPCHAPLWLGTPACLYLPTPLAPYPTQTGRTGTVLQHATHRHLPATIPTRRLIVPFPHGPHPSNGDCCPGPFPYPAPTWPDRTGQEGQLPYLPRPATPSPCPMIPLPMPALPMPAFPMPAPPAPLPLPPWLGQGRTGHAPTV